MLRPIMLRWLLARGGRFVVSLAGEGFDLQPAGSQMAARGFYGTRFIKAKSAELAAAQALALAAAELERLGQSISRPPRRVWVTKVRQVRSFGGLIWGPGGGFTWWCEDDD